MKYQDYYAVLGVDRDANADEIKKAYRRLARKYHPDVSQAPDAEEKFKALGEAYDVLKDPEKRGAYDQLGADWQAGQEFRPPPDWSPFGFDNGYAESHFEYEDLSDLFRSMFGAQNAGYRRSGPQSGSFGSSYKTQGSVRGADLRSHVYLTLEQLYNAEPVELSYRDGVSDVPRTLRVTVPSHLREGESFRLKGQGVQNPTNATDNGDLYVELRLIPHPTFTLEGSDILTTLLITPWEAALGASVSVPTLGGPVSLKIPAGSQSGTRLRLKGRGLVDSKPGHQVVILQIRVPAPLSAEEEALFEALKTASSFNPREQER